MIIDQIKLILIITTLHLIIFTRVISASSKCPVDLNYVLTIEWDTTSCTKSEDVSKNCCQTLTSLYGIGIAKYLKQTSLFRLSNLETSISCLLEFQNKLSKLNLPLSHTSQCFQPENFVNTTNICANIQSKQDWITVLGQNSSLDIGCKKDLSDLTACDQCVHAGFEVTSRLLAVDGNSSHSRGCFYFAVLYAAGIVNEFGPESYGSLSCIFGLPLSFQNVKKGRMSDDVVLVISVGAVFASLVAITCLVLVYLIKKQESDSKGKLLSLDSGLEYDGLMNWRPKVELLCFNIRKLEKATNKFSSKNLIGRGQFGIVYKGKLPDGTMIAVKKIMDSDFQRGNTEFCSEVEIISTLKHRNLLPLRGCCISGGCDYREGQSEKYLVFDYMPNGNLDDHLFCRHNKKQMNWQQRKNIILDVANALAYLHYGVKPPIYHRDIKPTNILLDSCMRARVADFGLAKQGKEGESHISTRIAGTHGYLAPEYALYGQLSEKSDVYSFGIVILEIMSGRKAIDTSSSTFLVTDWAWLLVKSGKIDQVLDTTLLGEYPKIIMERFVMVGILCAHLMVALRPTIMDALKMLQGDIEVPIIPDRPFLALSSMYRKL